MFRSLKRLYHNFSPQLCHNHEEVPRPAGNNDHPRQLLLALREVAAERKPALRGQEIEVEGKTLAQQKAVVATPGGILRDEAGAATEPPQDYVAENGRAVRNVDPPTAADTTTGLVNS